MMPIVLVTGATGFIGKALVPELIRHGYRVRLALRHQPLEPSGDFIVTSDLTKLQHLDAAMCGVDYVVHLAGLAHATSSISDEVYHQVNCEATLQLANAALRAKVKTFIYLSSIRAVTEPVSEQKIYDDTSPHPVDAYGRSKLAAEQGLGLIPLNWAALRPVLVYGKNVKGNMASLIRLAQVPFPLPLKGLKAQRSLVSLENVIQAVIFLLQQQTPLRQSFIVSDEYPVTVPEIITHIRKGLGRTPGLFSVQDALLKKLFLLAKRHEAYSRLTGSLVVEPKRLKMMGWHALPSDFRSMI